MVAGAEFCLLFLFLSLELSQHHLYRKVAITVVRELESWHSRLVSLNFTLLELLNLRLLIYYILLLCYLFLSLI